jgi:hypothetical protein
VCYEFDSPECGVDVDIYSPKGTPSTFCKLYWAYSRNSQLGGTRLHDLLRDIKYTFGVSAEPLGSRPQRS